MLFTWQPQPPLRTALTHLALLCLRTAMRATSAESQDASGPSSQKSSTPPSSPMPPECCQVRRQAKDLLQSAIPEGGGCDSGQPTLGA